MEIGIMPQTVVYALYLPPCHKERKLAEAEGSTPVRLHCWSS